MNIDSHQSDNTIYKIIESTKSFLEHITFCEVSFLSLYNFWFVYLSPEMNDNDWPMALQKMRNITEASDFIA